MWGIGTRIYWILPSILSDPFDIAERWFGVKYEASPYMFWILLLFGLFMASFLTYYHDIKDIKINQSGLSKPKIEDFMIPLIVNYVHGMKVSKDIQLRVPSAQLWNKKLSPSQRDKILNLVKWLGQDPRDYVDNISKSSPSSPSIRWL